MDEQLQAANADVLDVGTSEELATPQETPVTETEPQGQVTQPTETQVFARRLKEATERAREEAREEALKSHPTLTYLEKKAQSRGMTVEQLIDNDRQYEEQQKINELIQKNIPPEIAQEVYEGRKFRETYTTKEKEMQQKQEQQQMYSEFLEAYPDFKDPQKANGIPPEVWQAVNKGEKLTNAYARYENQQLKAEMAKYQQQQQVVQANEKNAGTSTGSVKNLTKPQSQDPFLDGFNSVR